MKKQVMKLALEMMAGAIVGVGGSTIAHDLGFSGMVSLVVTLAFGFGTLIIFEVASRRACAESVKAAFDMLVDEGNPPIVGGKQWQKHWRIDPVTGAVIDAT